MHRLQDLHMSEQSVVYEIPFLRSSKLSNQCLSDSDLEKIKCAYVFTGTTYSSRTNSNL